MARLRGPHYGEFGFYDSGRARHRPLTGIRRGPKNRFTKRTCLTVALERTRKELLSKMAFERSKDLGKRVSASDIVNQALDQYLCVMSQPLVF